MLLSFLNADLGWTGASAVLCAQRSLGSPSCGSWWKLNQPQPICRDDFVFGELRSGTGLLQPSTILIVLSDFESVSDYHLGSGILTHQYSTHGCAATSSGTRS